MKKTIIIVIIGVLSVAAICIGVILALMPKPIEQVEVDPYTPNNLANILEIEKPNKKIERLMAIRTYEKNVDMNDINTIAKNTKIRYYILDENATGHLLIVPFEINGKLTISEVYYDSDYEEDYLTGQVIFSDDVTENYALLLKYDRPDVPEYEIKLTQGKQTATYRILNKENGVKVEATQLISEDIDE